jgi:hypothetical protein
MAPDVPVTLTNTPRRPRPLLHRLLGAALVFRLEVRAPAPLDTGLILLAWLRRPAIEMPLEAARLLGRQPQSVGDHWRRRLDEVYPF